MAFSLKIFIWPNQVHWKNVHAFFREKNIELFEMTFWKNVKIYLKKKLLNIQNLFESN